MTASTVSRASAAALALLLVALAAPATLAAPLDDGDAQIIGGETTDIMKVPYQVSIEQRRASTWAHQCGGSVLSATWILTAAHCVYGAAPIALQVRAGTSTVQRGGSATVVAQTVVHPRYVSGRADWDVALVRLAAPLPLGAAVKAVSLPTAGREPATNSPVVVSGWGYTTPEVQPRVQPAGALEQLLAALLGTESPAAQDLSPGPGPGRGSVSTLLRKVTVRVVSRVSCTSAYSSAGVITDRMLCAAAPGKDACTLDSGGPLVDAAGVQVGVVSWGKGCADARYPGVYVHLGNADVRSFIKSNAKL